MCNFDIVNKPQLINRKDITMTRMY